VSKKQSEAAEFSPRSQASVLAATEIEAKIASVRDTILDKEEEQRQLEQRKETRFKHSLKEPHNRAGAASIEVASLNTKTAACRDEIKALQEHLAFLQEHLKNITTGAGQERDRQQRQQLATLTAERLKRDWRIDEMFANLDAELRERDAQTVEMAEIAATLEMKVNLDQRRFDELHASLPEGVGAKSESWAGWFLGKPTDAKTYVVRDIQLVLPETLAHPGIYNRFDRVELYDEQARELLRTDRRPRITNSEVSVNHPPSIVLLEEFEALSEEADDRGVEIEYLWAREQSEAVRQAHLLHIGFHDWVSSWDAKPDPLPERKSKAVVA
jgi:hypothetical protein